MTQANKKMKDERPDRRVRVRGVQRKDPDPKRIGEVVVALALAQAEKEAQEAKHCRNNRRSA